MATTSEQGCKKLVERRRRRVLPYEMRVTFSQFSEAVEARLRKGRRRYGDKSLRRSAGSLIGEIEEELLDVMGWTFLAWRRLKEIEKKVTDRRR